jgi:hypothetical protein
VIEASGADFIYRAILTRVKYVDGQNTVCLLFTKWSFGNVDNKSKATLLLQKFPTFLVVCSNKTVRSESKVYDLDYGEKKSDTMVDNFLLSFG